MLSECWRYSGIRVVVGGVVASGVVAGGVVAGGIVAGFYCMNFNTDISNKLTK